MPHILVVGSINVDLVIRTPRIPGPGETIIATDLTTYPGGKGANQAVAAARVGGKVRMIGRVGNDSFGRKLRRGLEIEGVDIRHVEIVSTPTGMALITVDEQGQNRIIVCPGANHSLVVAELAPRAFKAVDVVLVQLEIPVDTALEATRLGRSAGSKVILNLAPAIRFTPSDLRHVDLLLVNESEAAILLEEEEGLVAGQPGEVARELTSWLPQVVITLGEKGAVWATRDAWAHEPGFRVTAVDTTGAGDAFAGVLAVTLASGAELSKAVERANAAGALAASRLGAQPSMPHSDRIEILLKSLG